MTNPIYRFEIRGKFIAGAINFVADQRNLAEMTGSSIPALSSTNRQENP